MAALSTPNNRARLRQLLRRRGLLPSTAAPMRENGLPPQRPQSLAAHRRLGELARCRQELAALGLESPYLEPHGGVSGDTIGVADTELINFSGYNYLGLSGHPRVSRAAKDAIDRFGTSVSASRLVSGEIPAHRQLESALARFLGTEDALVFVSGHATNVSVISCLLSREDLVLYDKHIHDSVLQGCALSGAHRLAFAHNDWRELDRLLTEHRAAYRHALVVIEGVYSMDGDVPDLPRFIEVRQRHEASLMVDEAHSIGALGPSGRGLAEHFGVERENVDLWMGTLSKSLASCGGYVAASCEMIEVLKHCAGGFVFSVGISPANTAAALAALECLEAEPQRVERLQHNHTLFRSLAAKAKLDIGPDCSTQVVPLYLGSTQRALDLAQKLRRRGILVHAIHEPAVPANEARLRFFISATHTEAQLKSTVAAIADELAKERD